MKEEFRYTASLASASWIVDCKLDSLPELKVAVVVIS